MDENRCVECGKLKKVDVWTMALFLGFLISWGVLLGLLI